MRIEPVHGLSQYRFYQSHYLYQLTEQGMLFGSENKRPSRLHTDLYLGHNVS